MKKKLLIKIISIVVFISVAVFSYITSANAYGTSICHDNPNTPNWGWCVYFPETGDYICLNDWGPADTCDGINIE